MIIPALILPLLTQCTALAAPAHIERISIEEQGILITEIPSSTVLVHASDGQMVSLEHAYHPPHGNIMRPSAEIPAVVGTSFGYRFKIQGEPDNAIVKLDTVIRYPAPGRRNEKTGKLSRESISRLPYQLGKDYTQIVELEDPDLIPGTWHLEIRRGKDILASVPFILSKPLPPAAVNPIPKSEGAP
jgi:hypothetical protein